MQYVYYCLVFLSTVSVAVLFEVKKVYVIERDFKTGQLRARRQNVPAPSHTVARIGGLDHQLHHHHLLHHQPPPPQQQQQQLFSVAVSPPPLQSLTAAAAAGGHQQQPQQPDLASTVDLTTAADSRAPIDYLTPPPSGDFQMQNFLVPSGAVDQMVRAESSHHAQQLQTAPALGPFAAPAPIAVQTSPFTPVAGGFQSGLQAQPPPLASIGTQSVQLSSPSNQVNSLTFASPPLEHFTPYTPTLVQNEPPPSAGHLHQQHQQHQHQLHHPQAHQQSGGRWELGFDASDILTPPFASSSASDQPGQQQLLFQQDFGQEPAASSTVRNNKQYVGGGGGGGGGLFFGGSYDTPGTTNTKFTPQDAVVRTSPSNTKNVYWGTPKSAQQLPLRPPPSYVEPNAYRFQNNQNNHHHHHQLHHPQYVDTFQMPFTAQFDGPLSQGTVADHVVHSSFRIKRELGKYIYDEVPQVREEEEQSPVRSGGQDEVSDDVHDGDRKPVYSYVKTDRNGNFKWSVRHGY